MWMAVSLALAADHTNHYEAVKAPDGDVAIGLDYAWARDTEVKLKFIVENNTKDFLLLNTEKVLLDLGGEFEPSKSKMKVVAPHKSAQPILMFAGEGMHVEAGTLLIDGMALVSASSPTVIFPDYRLPLESKTFKTGDFACGLAGKIKKQTDETKVVFKCTYSGQGVAVVDESRIQVRMPNGKTYGNEGGNISASVVQPGESFKLKTKFHVSHKVADMQFAEMQVVFNDAVRIGEPKAIPAQRLPLKLWVEQTEKENR